MSEDRLLVLSHVSKSYGAGTPNARSVLKNVTLEIRKRSFNVLYGASGCGKTTLLYLIGGLDRPDEGEIVVDGQRVSHMSARDLTRFRRERVGFVFQSFNLLPTLTAAENVEAALDFQPMTRVEKRQRASTYLRLVGLEDAEERRPSELSGGEQQRVGVGRALAKHPSIILADEPTGNLDDYNTDQIISLLVRLWKERDVTLLIATHNPKFTEHAQQIFHISNGSVLAA